MEATGFEINRFFLQNTRGCTENLQSKIPQIFGRKIFRTTKNGVFHANANNKKNHM